LLAFNGKKYVWQGQLRERRMLIRLFVRIFENQHLLDATEIFRKLNVHKKVCLQRAMSLSGISISNWFGRNHLSSLASIWSCSSSISTGTLPANLLDNQPLIASLSMIVALIRDESHWLQERAGHAMRHGAGHTWRVSLVVVPQKGVHRGHWDRIPEEDYGVIARTRFTLDERIWMNAWGAHQSTTILELITINEWRPLCTYLPFLD
jgi:hypothetical protein